MKTQKGFATTVAIIIGLIIIGVGIFTIETLKTNENESIEEVDIISEDVEPVVASDTTRDNNIDEEVEEKSINSDDLVVCTADAMQCPDGSYVGRTGSECEFVCPDIADDLSEGLEFMFVGQEDLVTTATGQKNLIMLPVTIEGSVDIAKWTAFEGNAGLVKIYGYYNGEEKEIASAPIQLDDFDYDTNKEYTFSVTLGDRQWMSNLDNSSGKIIFVNYSQKDGGIINSMTVFVEFDLPQN
jgi:hypothetical protein